MGTITVDKLLGKPLMHTHNGMTVTYLLFRDANGDLWQVTMDTSGAFVIVPYDTYIITQSGSFLTTEGGDFLVL